MNTLAIACSAKGYNHGVFTHSKGEYVVGAIHTNSIESFWSLLKRGIVGSYHKVSKEHLSAYISAFEFRFNNRKTRICSATRSSGCFRRSRYCLKS